MTDLADNDAVRAAYADGATIVLNSLHRIWPPISALCRGLSMQLGHQTQCNAYITPAGRAQGFAFHHDTHDVFVLQVQGRKHWQVYPPVLMLPTKTQPRSGTDLVRGDQEPIIDVILEPGDSLYLPRGFVHAAATTDEPSIHLTVGINVTTWLDVAQSIVARFGPDDLHLRRALPPFCSTTDDEVASGFRKQLSEWVAGLSVDEVRDLVDSKRATARPLESLGVMSQAAAVAGVCGSTAVRPRDGLEWSLESRGNRVSLDALGKRIDFPAAAEPILRYALARSSTPESLVSAGLETADAIVVVRRLLREGILAPAD